MDERGFAVLCGSVQLSAVLTILCAASALAGLSRSLDEEAVEERVVLLP